MNAINKMCQYMLKFECCFLQQMMLCKSLIKITKINYSDTKKWYDGVFQGQKYIFGKQILRQKS